MGSKLHEVTLEERRLLTNYGVRYARGRCGVRTYTGNLRINGYDCRNCERMVAAGRKRTKPIVLRMLNDKIITVAKPYPHQREE